MKRFLKMYWVEQKMFLKSADALFFCVLMPIIAFIIIALAAGNQMAGDSGLTYLQGGFVSLSTVGVCCSAFMSIPIVLVEYRAQKVLRRMYCSPCSPVRLILCDVISSGLVSIISIIVLSLVAVCFGYRMDGNVFVFIGIWLFTMISMFSIGCLIASLCRSVRSMNIATTCVYFPMLLFSGATVPLEIFPKGIQVIGEYMPLGVGISLLKEASIGIYSSLWKLGILGAIAIVCTIVSIKTFKWE